MRILNLYSGLGGNRKLWEGNITAVESNEKIAAVYNRLYPQDKLVIGDAHDFLIKNYQKYDFVWSSPPCQRHSKMVKFTKHKPKGYPDMRLYEEIIFLTHFFKGNWVVENVSPYYDPLIKPTQVLGRHIFWSNFKFAPVHVKKPKGFIDKDNVAGKKSMMEWLGIHFEENVYYDGNHCPTQVLRNCVHPIIGKHIFDSAMNPGIISLPNHQPEFGFLTKKQ